MKKRICVILSALLLLGLPSGCGCDNGADVGLVFVNDSDLTISVVTVNFEDRESGVRNANSSPLKRSETFGFEAGEYPATVAAYGDAAMQVELARLTIGEAPPDGERWYVTARSETGRLVLSADTRLPEGE